MDPIMALAEQHDLIVLEDAAHAFGGEYKGRKLGTIGHFGSFSFHEVKNITSFGEGGILCTSIEEFRPEMKRARFLGTDFSRKIKDWLYDVTPIQGKGGGTFVATNFSTTEIQGLSLIHILYHITEFLKSLEEYRPHISQRYTPVSYTHLLLIFVGSTHFAKSCAFRVQNLQNPAKKQRPGLYKKTMADTEVPAIPLPLPRPAVRLPSVSPPGRNPASACKPSPAARPPPSAAARRPGISAPSEYS